MNKIPPNFSNAIIIDAEAAQTVAMRVYDTLKADIISGKLPPGTRLVRRALAERLGVSTIPIIEALYRLERSGLVENTPWSGASVLGLTEEGIRNDSILREALESQAARLCAEKATHTQIARLYYMAGRLDEMMVKGDRRSCEGMQMHMEFHLLIAKCSGFPILEEELDRLWLRRMVLFSWLNASVHPIPPTWHHDLVAVIEQGKVEAADAKAREHVRYGQEDLLKTLGMIAGLTTRETGAGAACAEGQPDSTVGTGNEMAQKD